MKSPGIVDRLLNEAADVVGRAVGYAVGQAVSRAIDRHYAASHAVDWDRSLDERSRERYWHDDPYHTL